MRFEHIRSDLLCKCGKRRDLFAPALDTDIYLRRNGTMESRRRSSRAIVEKQDPHCPKPTEGSGDLGGMSSEEDVEDVSGKGLPYFPPRNSIGVNMVEPRIFSCRHLLAAPNTLAFYTPPSAYCKPRRLTLFIPSSQPPAHLLPPSKQPRGSV